MKKLYITALILGLITVFAPQTFCIEEISTSAAAPVEDQENKFDYINMAWWNNFNDPYLTEYIEKAVNYNHNLKIATISAKEYYQTVKMQFANELPSLGGGFAPAYVKEANSTESGFQFAVPLLVNYEIDLFLKNRDKTKSARKNYEISLIDERGAYISTVSAVGSTYLNIVKLDKNIELQKKILEERKIIYDLMFKRHLQGITSTADTIRANKAYIAALTELNELEKQRDSLLHSFCVLIGESSSNKDDIQRKNFDELVFDGIIPDEISSNVIEERPDYQKAMHYVEKAGIDVRVAKKEFLPSFSIGGLALFNAADLGKIFNTSRMLNALGGLSWFDIFKGGAKVANYKLKKASLERVLEEYQQTNLTAIQEVNDALLFIKKDTEKLGNTLKQQEFEVKDNGFYKNRYDKGIISKLDLAQSEENLLTVNKLAVNQQIDCYIDYIGLYKAAGSKIN